LIRLITLAERCIETLYLGVLICGKYGAFKTKRRHHLRHCFAKVSVYAVVEAKQGDSLSPSRYSHLSAVDNYLVKVK